MKLTSFRVKGFKNFTEEVVLEDLSDINVIHGANNVGKSNLLQAMQLFFRLVGLIPDLPNPRPIRLSDTNFESMDLVRSELFNLYRPRMPIYLEGDIVLEESEIELAGLKKEMLGKGTIGLKLEWQGTHVDFGISRFLLGTGEDAVAQGHLWSWAVDFSKEISQNFLVREKPTQRFAYIRAARLVEPHLAIDRELALDLYDAKEATEAETVQRWERFVEAMSQFSDILGEGAFVAIYERKLNRANMVFHTEGARILLSLLGSGVQQVVNLVGYLLMTKASLVAIEEPEQNLKFDLQERLREVFANIVGKSGGPSQLFLTSHSPTFESGDHFYFMRPTPNGPMVEKRNRNQAMAAVGFPTEVPNLPEHATLSYVSTDGVVRLHPSVMQAMGLPNGGGVMFIDGDRSVEMMSNDRFIERLGLEDGNDSEH